MFRLSLAVLALCLMSPLPLAAACPDANGFVSNCGFESDTSGWGSPGDSLTRITSAAHSGTASGQIDAGYNDVLGYYMYQMYRCVPVNSGGTFEMQGWIEGASGATVNNCGFQWAAWSSSLCNTGYLDGAEQATTTVPDQVWTDLDMVIQVPVGAHGVRFLQECLNNPTDFLVNVDDLNLVGPLFYDGFESGDTSIWSTSVIGPT